jgi:hypothetical protein
MENYKLGDVIAVQWNPELAELFPNADHTGCRQEMRHDGTSWFPYNPVRCFGWHCNRCGKPTNIMGHHDCNNPPCTRGAGL